MRYMRSVPVVDMDANEDFLRGGWTPFKRLSKSLSLTFQILIIIALALKASMLLTFLNPSLKIELQSVSVIAVIFIFFAQIIIHEMVHACFMPGGIRSNAVYIGLSFSTAFTYTTQEIKRGRYLLMTMAPLFLLSVLLPVILSLFGGLGQYASMFCFFNAIGSCADCLNLVLVLFGVPNGARIICNGPQIYYKH